MSTPSSGQSPAQPHPLSQPSAPARKDLGPGKIAAALAYLLRGRRRPGEVTIVSHSNLFYWWPVWLVGFVMAVITFFDNVHAGFVVGHGRVVTLAGEPDYKFDDPVTDEEKAKYPKKDIHAIISDRNDHAFPTTRHGGEEKHMFPYMTSNKNVGVIFAITLLVVIVVTNVPLRGLWSVIVIITIVLGSIIFALAGWWDYILTHGRLLAIHINLGAYLFISLTLMIIWVVNVCFFDRQRYTIVTSGQVRVQLAVGEGAIVYDTTGMVFQKQRSDLFRHWILGLGSGDLIIRPAGGKDPIDLPNVLFVGTKVKEIQNLIKEKEVVTT